MRFIDIGEVSPEYSVCADRTLLNMHSSDSDDILLFYSRDRPCISVGRFQKTEDAVNTGYTVKNNIQAVRRVSGGSSIYSDRDQLTYSLIVSKDRLPASRGGSFAVICNAIVLGLKRLGIDGIHKPVNDILVNNKKISGGAQARNRYAVLQHGSIILDVDDSIVRASLTDNKKRSYSGLTSIKECLGYIPLRDVIVDALASGFSDVFGPAVRDKLSGEEEKRIRSSFSCSGRSGP